MKYAGLMNSPVAQTEPLNERQIANNAGGFVFQLDDWARLDRFLILGSDAPTYYQKAKDLTRDNARVVDRCLTADAARTVARVVEISDTGRAPKNDPAIFALAIGAAHQDEKTRKLALSALPMVCRTSTHLFQFVKAAQALGRGWGRSMKTAVANWYNSKTLNDVAFQAVKYREREGFSHKRLLQTAHPAASDSPARIALYRWMRGLDAGDELPGVVQAHLRAMSPGLAKAELIELIEAYRLPWEAIPTEAKADADVWTAMLPHLGLSALVRNLGNLSKVGAIKPLSANEALIQRRLSDDGEIRKSRLHPFAILQAMAVYGGGHSHRGRGEWVVSQPVLDALDKAFYKAFANVTPSGKRTLLAIDCSDSMTWSSNWIGGVLPAREAAAAMALVTDACEPYTHIVGFSSPVIAPLPISSGMGLNEAVRVINSQHAAGTDCALPMLYALKHQLAVDTFVIYTDNETHSGRVHPTQALKEYRKASGIPAKLIVVGMTSTGFTIADPRDGGMLDVVGFDSAAPAVMADFAR